ncbi:MAG: hypothetical protein KAG61_05785 [Bacteriovoracaceae bacterium]|nr:hypothetical protein [Bacteriovoracaceae bacterium]
MDYYHLISGTITGAIAGGIAGLIIAYFGKKAKENERYKKFKKSGVVAGVMFFMIANGAVNNSVVKNFIMSQFDRNYAFKVEISKRMAGMLDIPEVKSKLESIKSPAEANKYTRNLVHNGLKRLTWGDLKKWNMARLAMAEISPELCSGFWSGKLSEDMMMSAMAQLPKDTMDDWIEISTRSAKLEVAQGKYAKPTWQDFEFGLKTSVSKMTHEDQVRMETVLAQGVSASPKDGCWMMKVMLMADTHLDQIQSEKFIRYMASF